MAQADYVIVTEIFYSGAWRDISADVRNRDPVTIERGRPDESSKVKPGKLTLLLNNGASRAGAGIVGRYSPRNPRSDLFGLIGRNTPVRQSLDGQRRFTGEISEWPTRWDLSGADVWVNVRAYGILRRLGQGGGKPILSAFRRRIEAEGATAYWPLDSGELVEVGAPVFGAAPFRVAFATVPAKVQLGTSDLAPWVGPGLKVGLGGGLDPALNQAEIDFDGAVSMPTSGLDDWTFEAMMRFPDGPVPRGQASLADSSVVTAWRLVGNGNPRIDWIISTTTDNVSPTQKGWSVQALDEDANVFGTKVFDAVDHADGLAHHVQLRTFPDAGGIFWDFAIDGTTYGGLDIDDMGEAYMAIHDAGRATTPDAAALDVVGDIDVRVYCALINWGSGSNRILLSKWGDLSANQNAYHFQLDAAGTLTLFWSTTGANFLSATSTVALPAFGSYAKRWVRATLDVDNGAAGRNVQFFHSTDGTNWTQLGATVTQAGVTSIFASTSPLLVGGRESGAEPLRFGRVFAAEVRNLIGGTAVANPDFRLQSPGTTSFTDAAGRTWTIAAPAKIEPANWPRQGIARAEFHYTGQAPSPPAVTIGHVTVRHRSTEGLPLGDPLAELSDTLQAGTGWLRERAGRRIERLCREEGIPLVIVGDWLDTERLGQQRIGPLLSLLDDAAATDGGILYENLGGRTGLFLTGTGHAVTLDTGFALDVGGDLDVRCFCALDDWTPAAVAPLVSKWLGPSQKSYLFQVQTDGTLRLFWTVAGTTNLSATSTVATGFADGAPRWVRATLDVNNGAAGNDVKFFTSLDGVTWTQLGTTVTQAGTTDIHVGTADLLVGRENDLVNPGVIGRIFYAEVRDGIEGAPGSLVLVNPDFRAQQPGITSFRDTVGSPDPSAVGKVWTIIAPARIGWIAETDLAGLGLVYATRRSLYNRPPTLQLDYSSGHISPPFDPTDDDQALENDVTVRRLDGGERRAERTTGPLSVLPPPAGVGRYDRSYTLNVTDDDRAAVHAAARVEIGTLDVTRFPEVGFRAVKHPELAAAVAGIDPGSRVTIDNPPPWLPPEQIPLILQGYRERYSLTDWELEWNTSPAEIYTGGFLDVDRLDTDQATVNTAFVAGTDSVMSVAWASTPVAATGVTDFRIRVAGVVLRCIKIENASSPQNFSVEVAPVNGVRKTIPVGSPVRLAAPMRLVF